METLTFPNFTEDRFSRLKTTLAAKGLSLAADSGEIKEFGADVIYSYVNQTLSLTINKAPIFHSMNGFCQQIRTAIEDQE